MATNQLSGHRCALCNRRLYIDRWVYSRHTGARYCPPGEGCEKQQKEGK